MSETPKITIVSVNWHSSRDLSRLFKNLRDKAVAPERLSFLIIDNTNGSDEALNAIKEANASITVIANNPSFKIGSQNHASGLNQAKEHLKSPYLLITDPDVFIFKKGWDTWLIDTLDQRQVAATGTVYPPWQLGKYHDFPSPIFSFYRTDRLDELGPDWMCFNEPALTRLVNIALLLVLRCGYLLTRERYLRHPLVGSLFSFFERILPVCSCETGWQLANCARKRRFPVVLFDCLLPDRIPRPLLDTLSIEQQQAARALATHFELYGNQDQLILTHRYSSQAPLWQTPRGTDAPYWESCINQLDKAPAN